MLFILSALFLLLSFIYGKLLHRFLKDWQAISVPPAAIKAPDPATLPLVSVLVPARNEAANIENLIRALLTQQYPTSRLEIIIIDDHSEDQTAAIAASFKEVTLLPLQEEGINSYKKKALEKGVSMASGSLVICTDADCIPGPHWIEQLVSCYLSTDAAFIAAPVVLQHQQNWLGYLQALDFMILQGITGAGIQSKKLLMANGANQAYPRAVFTAVNGYAGADRIASGDDLFLLHKISDHYPNKIVYLKSKLAIVTTAAQESWSDFLQQRIRWASKSAYYKKGGLQAVLLLVWGYNLVLLTMAMGSIVEIRLLPIFIIGWLLKTMLEWSFVKEVAHFFERPTLLNKFFWMQPLHILYTVTAGLLGLKGGYRWKGRNVR